MIEGHLRKDHEDRSDLAGEYRWGDMGQLILFIVFVVGMVADVFLLHFSSFIRELIPWYVPVLLFIPLFLIAGFFTQKAHKKVFQEERTELMVIRDGLYARMRHPMYFGAVLMFLSFVVLSLSLIALGIFIIITMFFYFLCRYEERLLIEKLGESYKDYMKEVPMLFPKLRKN